jgi:hypothetical protein
MAGLLVSFDPVNFMMTRSSFFCLGGSIRTLPTTSE